MFQKPTSTVQKELGFAPDRLARIPQFLDNYVTTERLAGYGVLATRHGQPVMHHYTGRSAFQGGFPLSDDALFRIYSMTKPVTSVALLMLYEEGRVMLSDPVSKFIPEFGDLQVFKEGDARSFTTEPLERPMTIHDLMTHQSGLTYDFMASHPVDAMYRNRKIAGVRSEGVTLTEFTEQLFDLPLVCQPGSHWNYSVSTDVLGRVIEIISGQTLDSFLRDRIFAPLGMVDTDMTVHDDKLERLTHSYQKDPLSGKINLFDAPETSTFRVGRRFMSGGGGLVSTMPDYFKFAEMLRHRGQLEGVRILSPKSVEKMTSNQLPDNGTLLDRAMPGSFSEVTYAGTGFGLGVSVITNPGITTATTSRGNFAWGGLASTYFWVDPVEELTVILMCQLIPSGTYPIRTQLQQMLYAAME